MSEECLKKLASLNTAKQMEIYLKAFLDSSLFIFDRDYSKENIKKYIKENGISIDESLLDEVLDDN